MSSTSENLYIIYNNPIILTPIIIDFYKNYLGRERDVLLAYLILPLVLEENIRKKLKSLNSRSNIYTFISNKNIISGFNSRVVSYKKITNICLQYAVEKNFIKVDENFQVKILKEEEYQTNKEFHDATKNICKIFKELDIIQIYKTLGVIQL